MKVLFFTLLIFLSFSSYADDPELATNCGEFQGHAAAPGFDLDNYVLRALGLAEIPDSGVELNNFNESKTALLACQGEMDSATCTKTINVRNGRIYVSGSGGVGSDSDS